MLFLAMLLLMATSIAAGYYFGIQSKAEPTNTTIKVLVDGKEVAAVIQYGKNQPGRDKEWLGRKSLQYKAGIIPFEEYYQALNEVYGDKSSIDVEDLFSKQKRERLEFEAKILSKADELSAPIPDESEFRVNSGKVGTTYHKETLNLNTFK